MSDLSSVERLKIEALFGMESGYVLGFSNNTFSMFTVENVGIDIFDSKYEYGSSSKANRLRKFWLEESNEVVGKLLSALLDYWLIKKQTDGDELSSKEKTLYDECQKIVSRLNQQTFRQIQENTSSPSQKGGIFNNGMDMTYTKRPLKVFLCHAHADRDPVRRLCTRLSQDGVDAWLDTEKLLPGQERELEIRKAVREADVVVVCLSEQFNRAGFQQKEVRVALDTAMERLEGEIFIIPTRLEECNTPESLQRYQGVDIFNHGGYEKLIKALNLRGEQLDRARVQKEDAVKRRLPYFETPVVRDSVMQQGIGKSANIENKPNENIPLHESLVKSESEEQLSHKKTKAKRPIKTEYIVAIIGAVATLIAGILSSPLIGKWLIPTALVTITPTMTSQFASPLRTLEPSLAPTERAVSLPTAAAVLPTITSILPVALGEDWIRGCISTLWKPYPADTLVTERADGCWIEPVNVFSAENGELDFFDSRDGGPAEIYGLFAPLPENGTVAFTVRLSDLRNTDLWMGVFAEPDVTSQGLLMTILSGDVNKLRFVQKNPTTYNTVQAANVLNQGEGFSISFTFTALSASSMLNQDVFAIGPVSIPSTQKWLFLGYKGLEGAYRIEGAFLNFELK